VGDGADTDAFGLTLNAGRTLHLQGANSAVRWVTNQTMNGGGTVLFEGTNNSLSGQFSGQVVTLANGLTITGNGAGTSGSVGSTFFTTNNQALIVANSGETLSTSNIVNQAAGVLRVNGGTLNLDGTWTNPGGVIDLLGGTLNLNGTFSSFGGFNRPGGTAGTDRKSTRLNSSHRL